MKRVSVSTRWRWLCIIVLTTLFALLPLTSATAADVRTDDAVVVGPNEVVADDLYAFATTVTINGTVKGDLVTAAREVTVNGTVEGDIMAAARTVVINGSVGETVRTAGAVVFIGPQAQIGKDLVAAGGSIETQAGSSVAGDALLGAAQALLAGHIGRDVQGGLDRLELRGSVGGNIDVTLGNGNGAGMPTQFFADSTVAVPSVSPGLTIADSARIGGTLSYHAPQQAAIANPAHVGEVTPTIQPAATPTPVNPFAAAGRHLVALLLVGMLLLWLLPRTIERLAVPVAEQPLPTLGWGAVTLAVIVTLMLVLIPFGVTVLALLFGMLTLGRLVLLVISLGLVIDALFATSFLIFISYVAQTVVGYRVGRWLLQRFQPAWADVTFAPLAVGILLYVVVAAIPVLGSFVALAVALLGLGAAWTWLRERFGRTPTVSAPLRPLQPVGM